MERTRRRRQRVTPTQVIEPIAPETQRENQSKSRRKAFEGEGKQIGIEEDNCTRIINKRICERQSTCDWIGPPNTGICLNRKEIQAGIRAEVLELATARPAEKIAKLLLTKDDDVQEDTHDVFYDALDDPFDDDADDDIFYDVDGGDDDTNEQQQWKQEVDRVLGTRKAVQQTTALEDAVVDANGLDDELNAEYVENLGDVITNPSIFSYLFNSIRQIIGNIPGHLSKILNALMEMVKSAQEQGAHLNEQMQEFATLVNKLLGNLVRGLHNAEDVLIQFFDQVSRWMQTIKPLFKGAYYLSEILAKFMIILLKVLYSILSVLLPVTFKLSAGALKAIIKMIMIFVSISTTETEGLPPKRETYQQRIPTDNDDRPGPVPPYRRQRTNVQVELKEEAERFISRMGGDASELGDLPVGLRKGEVFKKGYMGGGGGGNLTRAAISNVGSLVMDGVTLVAKPLGILNTVKNNLTESAMLTMEIESIKEWLTDVKAFVNRLLVSKISLCGLMDMMDTVNALQLFIYSNFMNPDTATKGFVVRWPEWYRLELQHAVNHVQRDVNQLLLELEAYDLIMKDELIRGATLTDLRNALLEHNSNCQQFSKWYQSKYAPYEIQTEVEIPVAGSSTRKLKRTQVISPWDVCETCTNRDTNFLTLKQSYKKIIKNEDDFKLAKLALEQGMPVPSVLIPPPFAKHGDRGLVSAVTGWLKKEEPKQMHLGKNLPPVYITDSDTETQSSIEGSEELSTEE